MKYPSQLESNPFKLAQATGWFLPNGYPYDLLPCKHCGEQPYKDFLGGHKPDLDFSSVMRIRCGGRTGTCFNHETHWHRDYGNMHLYYLAEEWNEMNRIDGRHSPDSSPVSGSGQNPSAGEVTTQNA